MAARPARIHSPHGEVTFLIPSSLNIRLWRDGFWEEANSSLGTIFDEYEADSIPPDGVASFSQFVKEFLVRYGPDDPLLDPRLPGGISGRPGQSRPDALGRPVAAHIQPGPLQYTASSISGGSAPHGEELPGAWHTPQLVLASVIELDAAPFNEILHHLRDEHFSRGGQRPYTGGDVDGQSSKVLASDLTFTRVQPHPKGDPELADRPCDGLRTPDGAGRSVEGGHKPVSRCVDLYSTKTMQLPTHGLVVGIEERAPPMVPQ